MEGAKVFIPDKEHMWLPASVKSVNGSVVIVKVEDIETGIVLKGMSLGASIIGKTITIDLAKTDIINLIQAQNVKSITNTSINLPLQNKPQIKTNGFEDMISVDHLHEGAILYNLRQRFFSQLPYTYTGKICIAVNPYQWLSLYSPETMKKYMDGSRENKPPHVYAVSMESFFHMRTHNINQSILVSGESGAGKTETTKIMMNHVATLSSHLCDLEAQTSIIHRIIQSNPLLESFGNAATTRNDNSSRFGKFTELQFDPRGRLLGARAHTYLLEKSRICHQASGERTFHIFYQLLEHAKHLPQLHLKAQDYRYVRQDVDLKLEHTLDDTKKGLGIVGISEAKQNEILSVLAAILHLGESEFQMIQGDVDSSQVKDKGPLTTVANLLGLPFDHLETVLTYRSVIVGREIISKPMTVDQARDCRDAVAKSLYSSMFTWLVDQINAAIGVNHVSHFIGILDIFGFEAFVHNSFEQLCINYANEKLQQKFVQDVLKTVQAEYEEEGISWSHVNFADNQDVLDLIEGRLGVLSLLNEESSLATGTDASFAHKLSTVMDSHARFETPRLQSSAFIILHYAGRVLYDTNGFLDKHRDALLPDIKRVLSESSVELVRTMFPSENTGKHLNRQSSNTTNTRQRHGVPAPRAVTVGSQFKESLARLMDKISHTNVHYVRCIKPNSLKSPNEFNHEAVVDQLRCAGVIEAIRVSRSAYPSRISHIDCLKSYSILAPTLKNLKLNEIDDRKEECMNLMAILYPNGYIMDYQVGINRVYFRESILDDLEKRRGIALKSYAIRIQKEIKMFFIRRLYLKKRNAILLIQKCIRGYLNRIKYIAIRKKIIKIQSIYRSYHAKRIVIHLRRIYAILKLQSIIRMYSNKKIYKKKLNAILKVQNFWRTMYWHRQFLKRLIKNKKQRALGTKILNLQTQLDGNNNRNIKNENNNIQRTSTSHLFNESSQILGTLVEENHILLKRIEEQEKEINLLKDENRKIKESLQSKEVDDKVKNLSKKSHEASQIAYLSLLEEEYEKLRFFLCNLVDIPNDIGILIKQNEKNNLIDLNNQKKQDVYTLLNRSAIRLQRLRSKEINLKRGSARRVKDYWDEIKTNAPLLPYTLGSTPWKRLLTDWAQGNPKKLEYMTKWLQNVLDGGDIENGGYPLGVELKSVTPMMLEGFIQLIIPKLAERQDIKVHVHTKEFIGTSMRITLEVKNGIPKMIPIKNEIKQEIIQEQQWERNSIISIRDTNFSSFTSNGSNSTTPILNGQK